MIVISKNELPNYRLCLLSVVHVKKHSIAADFCRLLIISAFMAAFMQNNYEM